MSHHDLDLSSTAKWISRLVPASHRASFLGDLIEEARKDVLPEQGETAAQRWVLTQLLWSLPAMLTGGTINRRIATWLLGTSSLGFLGGSIAVAGWRAVGLRHSLESEVSFFGNLKLLWLSIPHTAVLMLPLACAVAGSVVALRFKNAVPLVAFRRPLLAMATVSIAVQVFALSWMPGSNAALVDLMEKGTRAAGVVNVAVEGQPPVLPANPRTARLTVLMERVRTSDRGSWVYRVFSWEIHKRLSLAIGGAVALLFGFSVGTRFGGLAVTTVLLLLPPVFFWLTGTGNWLAIDRTTPAWLAAQGTNAVLGVLAMTFLATVSASRGAKGLRPR